MSTTQTTSLAKRWAELKRTNKALRIRDAAERLNCSEAELVFSALANPELHEGFSVVRLMSEPASIFARIPALGRVMALTRNDAVVSETYGEYGEIDAHGNVAVVHTEGIDLRVDFSHWHHCFAVTMSSPARTLRGLQFFDADGQAVHKVYLTEDSDPATYDAIVSDLAHPDPWAPLELSAARPTPDTRGGNEVDDAVLRDGWAALTNVHQFTALLARLKVNRLTALRHVGPRWALPGRPDAHRALLERVRDSGVPIMVFVRSPGCTQIKSGSVARLMENGEYFNVFDPEFHLHIREPRLHEAWVVRKPTAGDTVTSVEIYAEDGELVLQFFGVRGEDGREDLNWREVAEAMAADPSTVR